ncbi:MAG: efflux transporter outer membrane subunit [Rhodanobacteraceae bacterium]|jgi:multidrug efflux system outer membrane protein|nr:efflux transporter outer membrane subunit [Rhodanobacteraceae bacterium]MBL0039848.1 efflux transporter outer membrane subunit [Xanthomonadales bacterium]MBP6077736.1 efflux transporter outer membrane subunit [Xanthomonadales bacterium]MBP7622340.1 efflux transporter outer membrane subunit [Xanthomonadales bacterium]
MRKLPLALALTMILSGCMLGPDYARPDLPLPEQFAQVDAEGLNRGDALAHYWDAFPDALLKELIAEALAANHDLRIAQSRLGETRASRRAALSDLFPLVTASAKRDRSKRSPEEMPGVPADQLRSDFYDAGFDASWEVSLFGRGMRGVQAQNAFRDAAIANLWGTQVAVTAELARNYFELRGLQARRDVVVQNAESQKAALAIAEASVDAGRSSELDRQRAIAQHETTLATLPRIDTAITRTIYRIAVLTGRTPQALDERLAAVAELPALPDLVPVGTPADLLRRRPDILAAERDLAGRSAMIGYRLAELFPRVFFIGGVGTSAASSGDLGDSGTARWSFAPQLQWAAFDLPRVFANVGVERARHEAALARYEQVVLLALEDADGALRAYEQSAVARDHLQRAAAASAEATRLSRLRYENGLTDFLSVLDADRARLAADDALIQAHTESATSLIAVFKALGGGWDGPPETE